MDIIFLCHCVCTGPKSKVSSSVSMDSLVSLSDVEFGEEDEEAGLVHVSRYLEECDTREVGEEGKGERDTHNHAPRQVSSRCHFCFSFIFCFF